MVVAVLPMKDKANWFALQHHIIIVLTISSLVLRRLLYMFAVVGRSLNNVRQAFSKSHSVHIDSA